MQVDQDICSNRTAQVLPPRPRAVARYMALLAGLSLGFGLAPRASAVITCDLADVPPLLPCTGIKCTNGQWVYYYRPVGTACDDSNPCTTADTCVDAVGTCRGTPKVCAPRGPCETAACNATGACAFTPRPAGTVCPNSTNPCENVCDGAAYLCQP